VVESVSGIREKRKEGFGERKIMYKRERMN
jgi:hypothetical protein